MKSHAVGAQGSRTMSASAVFVLDLKGKVSAELELIVDNFERVAGTINHRSFFWLLDLRFRCSFKC